MIAKPPEHIPATARATRTFACRRWLPFGLSLLWACRPDGAHAPEATSAPVEPVQVVLDTPENAARSVLTCLLSLRRARAAGDEPAVSQCEEQLLRMAARDTILQRHRNVARGAPRDPQVILTRFVRDWSSLVGYYADQLRLDRITLADPSSETGRTNVHVPAAVGPQGETTLRLECVRDAGGLWRVARIDFVPPSTSQPSTRPGP